MNNKTHIYTADLSNDRSYIIAEKEYIEYKNKTKIDNSNTIDIDNNIINIDYLKSGIFFNNKIQKGIKKIKK